VTDQPMDYRDYLIRQQQQEPMAQRFDALFTKDEVDVSGERTMVASGGGMALALFSYLGLESASVAAAKVRNPDRNIPRASVLGTIATAIVYMLSLTVVFGVVPNSELAEGTAPFSEAVNAMLGGTSAGNLMAIAVMISGFGALNG
jgi:basic amino acid/polyamine antiporter, APA family